MNKIRIFCKNVERDIEVAGGDSLLTLASVMEKELGFRPICALVNNKTEGLRFPVYYPKQVEFLSDSTRQGRDVYVRSLCMVLYKAVSNLKLGRLRIELSISKGYYCRILNKENKPINLNPETVERIKTRMQEIVADDIPFRRHERPTEEVIEIFRNEGLDDKVQLLETTNHLYVPYYTLGEVADSYYGPLAPSSGYLNVFNLIPYKDGFLLLVKDLQKPEQPATPITQEKIYKAFTDHLAFNRTIGVSNVGELNRVIESGHAAELINVAEALHDKLMGHISDEIAARRANGEAGIVMIAGPSSSGKTTSGKRLAVQLMTNLIRPKLISLDDYFVDRDKTPLDETGDYDFESLYALDLQRFNSDLEKLLAGKEINLPTYSFEYGKRIETPRPLRLESNEVLIIEGIHGLNPELTSSIDSRNLFKIYVSALTTLRIDNHNWISTTDNRLLRRIVRDHKYRHTPAAETIRRWPSVRRGEEKWIFPFGENADATFNSSLLFELGVMKEYAEPLLRSVPHASPQYTEAIRLLRFLDYFKAIPAEQVPFTSLLREFLGGSSFQY